jgi:hypothetical protein
MEKKTTRECFCALCRSPRKLRYQRHLSKLHYGQILLISFSMAALLYPWLGFKGILNLPIVWGLFESIHKTLYRKDLKCPFCGFDPTWYKRDVKLARKRVEEFLEKNPNSPIMKRKAREDSLALFQ